MVMEIVRATIIIMVGITSAMALVIFPIKMATTLVIRPTTAATITVDTMEFRAATMEPERSMALGNTTLLVFKDLSSDSRYGR